MIVAQTVKTYWSKVDKVLVFGRSISCVVLHDSTLHLDSTSIMGLIFWFLLGLIMCPNLTDWTIISKIDCIIWPAKGELLQIQKKKLLNIADPIILTSECTSLLDRSCKFLSPAPVVLAKENC